MLPPLLRSFYHLYWPWTHFLVSFLWAALWCWERQDNRIDIGLTSYLVSSGSWIYSYFVATRGTVKLLSRGSAEDMGNCCQRPKAEGNSFPDLLHYRGTMVLYSDGTVVQFPNAAGHPTPLAARVFSMSNLPRYGNRDVRIRLLPHCNQMINTRWGYAGNRTRISRSTVQSAYLYATAAGYCFADRHDRKHWQNVPNMKHSATHSVGYKLILIVYCVLRNIKITNRSFWFAFSHLPRCGQLFRQKYRNNLTWNLCATFS